MDSAQAPRIERTTVLVFGSYAVVSAAVAYAFVQLHWQLLTGGLGPAFQFLLLCLAGPAVAFGTHAGVPGYLLATGCVLHCIWQALHIRKQRMFYVLLAIALWCAAGGLFAFF